MKKAVIVLNGQYIPETLDDGFVICADGGCGLLRGAGLRPDIIIGDGDSMPPFYDIYSGVKSIKYPADKDMTDGEICVRYAAAEGFGDVVIYGALGGRQDHVEGNIALLYLAKRLGIKAVIKDKDIEIHYADNSRSFFATVKKNIFVSIVPFFSFVHIIKTTGLKYPLIDARIEKYSSLGISNVAVDEKISVEIKKSAALIIVNG